MAAMCMVWSVQSRIRAACGALSDFLNTRLHQFAGDATDGYFPRLDVQVRSFVLDKHAEQTG